MIVATWDMTLALQAMLGLTTPSSIVLVAAPNNSLHVLQYPTLRLLIKYLGHKISQLNSENSTSTKWCQLSLQAPAARADAKNRMNMSLPGSTTLTTTPVPLHLMAPTNR